MEDLQKLFDDILIANDKKREEEKAKVNSNTENLAKAIEELVGRELLRFDGVNHVNSFKLDNLLPFLEEVKPSPANNKHFWYLNEEKFELELDFSYSFFYCDYYYPNKEPQGLDGALIDLELLKELLAKEHVYLSRTKNTDTINDKINGRGHGLHRKDILTITLLRQKNIEDQSIEKQMTLKNPSNSIL